jgi:predicted metal-binding protein
MCSRAFVVSVSGPGKATYLFTDLPLADSAEALLQFSEIYLNSHNRNTPGQQFPEALQAAQVTKVPSVEAAWVPYYKEHSGHGKG